MNLKGLRPLVRRTCDALISIPLAGQVESLNVTDWLDVYVPDAGLNVGFAAVGRVALVV